MPLQVRCVLSTAVAIAACVSAAVAQALVGPQPEPEGTARLVGRVVAADDGRPVRRAYLILSGQPAAQDKNPRVVRSVDRHLETDADGRFEFGGLPAGSYHVSTVPQNGFVSGSLPRGVSLIDGQSLETTIRLTRTGAIVGRVLDEGREPVAGAQVHAVQRSEVGGDVRLSHAGRTATVDERGEYRLYGLAPGEYLVVATYRPQRISSHGVLSDVQRSDFSDAYYPDSSSSKGARSVVVRAGQDTEGVNFALTARRLVRVTVNAVNAAGVPLEFREAQLTLRTPELLIPAAVHRVGGDRPADGTFVFRDVPPGEYRLLVRAGQEGAYLDVTIGDQDVSLNVRTNVGATVSGRVLIDGQPAGTAATAFYGSVAARPPPWLGGPSYAEPKLVRFQNNSDRFALTGLRGPTMLTADVSGGVAVSLRRAGEELAGKTLELLGTEIIDDVVVEFTTKVAAVDVTITGTDPREESEPLVVVIFAEDPSLWRVGYLQYRSPHTSQDSPDGRSQTMKMRAMPAGRYLIAALRNPGVSDVTAPSVLETLRKQATRLTLVADQTATVGRAPHLLAAMTSRSVTHA